MGLSLSRLLTSLSFLFFFLLIISVFSLVILASGSRYLWTWGSSFLGHLSIFRDEDLVGHHVRVFLPMKPWVDNMLSYAFLDNYISNVDPRQSTAWYASGLFTCYITWKFVSQHSIPLSYVFLNILSLVIPSKPSAVGWLVCRGSLSISQNKYLPTWNWKAMGLLQMKLVQPYFRQST